MNIKELIKKVRKIEIKTKYISQHILSGEYSSFFKGRGMSFAQVKEYHFGDDVRSIDWNVTARQNKPYIKVFEEERERVMILAVDISKSNMFGSKKQIKKETITEICAMLAFSASQNNDKVGLVLFSTEVELYIPAKKGRKNILRIIRELIEFEPKNKGTSIDSAVKFLSNVLNRKSIIFIISDFNNNDYRDSLKVISSKHNLTGIRIYDQLESEMPDVGVVEFEDMESGEIILVNTSSKKVRDFYSKKYREIRDDFVTSFKKNNSKIIEIKSDEDYVRPIINFFKR